MSGEKAPFAQDGEVANYGDPDNSYTVDDAIEAIGVGKYQFTRFIVIAGSGFTQSAAMTLPTIIMVALACKFDLNRWNQAMLLIVMYIGNTIGDATVGLSVWERSLILITLYVGNVPGDIVAGMMSDRIGRKPCQIMGQWLLVTAVAGSAIAWNYYICLFFYFFIGFGIGMLTFTVIILVSELSPPYFRSGGITMFYIFWAIGTLYTAFVAWIFLNSGGWQLVTLAVAFPLLLVAIASLFIDESPKFLCTSGELIKAEEVLKKMAASNGKVLPSGTLIATAESERGQVSEMFNEKYRKTSILLCTVFFTSGLILYSAYSMLPYLLQKGYCDIQGGLSKKDCTFDVETLKETTIVTASEIIMVPIFAFLCEKLGRLPILRVVASVVAVVSTLLIFCLGKLVFYISLFLQRGGVQSIFLVLYIYTPEIYPTYIRGSSCGIILSWMTIGGIVSSVIVYPIGVGVSFRILFVILALAGVVGAVTTFFLKAETVGINLRDSREPETSGEGDNVGGP